ncbi:MAG TPA: hypothetical protein VFG86_08785, partial [Chloroflexota bacterium]|nr:hypothetical protein [Chloroflexota bacterium]
VVAPAEAALGELQQRKYRDDLEAALERLAELRTTGLPEHLARRIFGLWSNACYRIVAQRGWHEARRHAPCVSRGTVWARPTPGAPYQVVSSLDEPAWQTGQPVPERTALRAPLLRAASAAGARASTG